MNSFQFDECFDDKKLANLCNAEGHCVALRFPQDLKGTKDNKLLPILLVKDAPLVTRDFRIVDQHRNSVPARHSGVIVIRTRDSNEVFTSKTAARILAKFKVKFPQWHETTWDGIFLEINQSGISVCILHNSANTLSDLKFDDEEFAKKLTSVLSVFALAQAGVHGTPSVTASG